MGVATSRGRNNLQLVDNLVEDSAIETAKIELIFRVVDRGFFIPSEEDSGIYDSAPWKISNENEAIYGALHLSSPAIYSSVLEHLDLQKGHSFLNIGSGIGYMSSLAGLLIGSTGTSHGVELNSKVFEYALKKRSEFLQSEVPSCFDFCIPEYFYGNCFKMKLNDKYDRIYVGAKVPEGMRLYFAKMLKVGGICIMPYENTLQSIRRSTERTFLAYNISEVDFGRLIQPHEEHENKRYFATEEVVLPKIFRPRRLTAMCTSKIRNIIRESQNNDIIIRQTIQEKEEERERYPYDFSEDEMLSDQADVRNAPTDDDHGRNPERSSDGYTIYTLQRRRAEVIHFVNIPINGPDDEAPVDQRGVDMRDGLPADNGRQDDAASILETMMHRVATAVRNHALHLPDMVITDEEPSSSGDGDGGEEQTDPPRSHSAPIQSETARHVERRHIRQHMERVRERQTRPRDTSGSSSSSSSTGSNDLHTSMNRKRKRPSDDPKAKGERSKRLNCVPAPGIFNKKYVKMLPKSRNDELDKKTESSVSDIQDSSIRRFDIGLRKSIQRLDLPSLIKSQLLFEDISGKKDYNMKDC